MKPKSLEIFIPGPAGRLEAKYYKNPKFGSPVAIVLHPHPQYGGTMNNRIVQLMYNIFLENGFSVIKVNFRGVGKSDGVFDNGQGELSDAAAQQEVLKVRLVHLVISKNALPLTPFWEQKNLENKEAARLQFMFL